MRQREIADNIGKVVMINSGRDLGMDSEKRKLIGEQCTLIKQCKSGLLQVEHKGKFHSLAAYNVDRI